MKNFDWCAYTYRHRRMIDYLIEKLIHEDSLKTEMRKHAKLHDMDKILLYQVMDQQTAQNIHVEEQPHHLNCKKEKTYYDLVETVLDYESAPYTKPDKPLNAFDFTHKLIEMGLIKESVGEQLFQIMHELGIDYSGTVQQDTEGLAYAKQYENVTEEMILQEIVEYVKQL